MAMTTLSDLSQMFQLRRDTVRVRQDLATATQELSSGRTSDIGKSLFGNFSPLVGFDQQLSALDAYETNTKEAMLFTDAAQNALERVKAAGSDLGTELISLREADIVSVGSVFSAESEGAFEAAVSALNGSIAGRSVFGGASTDRAPLAAGKTMLNDIRSAALLLPAPRTAADIVAVVDDYFYTGGGGYQGSADSLPGFRVAEGRSIEMPVKANDPVIRDQLRGLAIAAMLDGAGVTDTTEKVSLAQIAGEAIISNGDKMLSLQAQVGSAQSRIETAKTQNASEKASLQMARNDIVSVDQYEVATKLQNLQVQLETIYTITARLSGLSLTNYLR